MAEPSREPEPEPVVFFDLTLGGMLLPFLVTGGSSEFLHGPYSIQKSLVAESTPDYSF